MSIYPTTFMECAQVVGPLATAGALIAAVLGFFRQSRWRLEETERAQLTQARLVASKAVVDAGLLKRVVVRNNGSHVMLDVEVWFQLAGDQSPIPVVFSEEGFTLVNYISREFILGGEERWWNDLSAKVPRLDSKELQKHLELVVTWTSPDGVRWRSRNNGEMLERSPKAKWIKPELDDLTSFKPAFSQDVLPSG
ncbi:hypothetical protein [Crossiella sp. NPDC003009]